MKICAAQTKPFRGDIQKNIEAHKKLIDLAISIGANTIIFPELSITGYEPEMANELATNANDKRFDDFQSISDSQQVTIGIGVPIKNTMGITISMVLFQTGQARQTYSKKYLHTSEDIYFTPGENDKVVIRSQPNTALAICYELSVPEHSANAAKTGTDIYIASVVEDMKGVEKAHKNLSAIGSKYSMIVLMSNCVGQTGAYNCAGGSAIWNKEGKLLGQLDGIHEGIILIDTSTELTTELSTGPSITY